MISYLCSMDVNGFENYLIYPDGRVFSKIRSIYLKPLLTRNKYIQVSLNNKRISVHRLVAEHYIPNDENKCQVDHINRDRSDNRVENLRWVTTSENQQNTLKRKTNKSGHKNISYNKKYDYWDIKKTYKNKTIHKSFKTKIECLCYKYILMLKIKADLFT